MKKLTFLVVGLLFASGSFFYSCEEGSEAESETSEVLAAEPSGIYGGCVIEEICIPEIEAGRKWWFNPAICMPGNPYQCTFFTGREHCFPVIVDCFWKWEEWWVDPWEWNDFIDPRDIYDFRKDLEDIIIDPREDFVTFKINENMLGFQYFNGIEGLIDKEVFNVHTSIDLDDATVESLGLKGNVIPAGQYPVVINEDTETFNAIVSVSEFPIVHEKQIAVGKYEGSSLTELLSKPQLEKIETSVVVETGKGVGLVGYTPNPEDPHYPPRPWPFPWPGPWPWPWVAIFSPNNISVGIQIYEPDPEPWTLEGELMLSDEVAKAIGIEAFKLTNENLEYQYDKELGISTILIHRPQ